MQGSNTILILCVYIGIPVYKERSHIPMISVNSSVQRCFAQHVLCVNIGTMFNKQFRYITVSRFVQSGQATRILCIYIGAFGQQFFDQKLITKPSRIEQVSIAYLNSLRFFCLPG